jgi:hypothetical protein
MLDVRLFGSEARGAYSDWYTKQRGAESEPSDFSIIAVGALNSVVG